MSVLEGTLSKWTNVMKGWQYRWFVLDENAGLLSYYTSKEKMMKGVRRGCVRLKGAVIGIDDQDVNTFTITVDHKTFHFQARDGEEREKWVRRLEDTILRHVHRNRAYWDNSISSQQGTPGSSATKSSNLVLFDKKVSEADAYLQLMIDQSTKLNDKINDLNVEEKEDQIEKLKSIQELTNSMLDSIKHSIVLLQITKNTAHPINGIYHHGPITSKSDDSDIGIPDDLVNMPPSVQTGIEVGAECCENRRRILLIPESKLIFFTVPETSYSSSEGEDDFYDANDDTFLSSHLTTPTSNTRTIPEQNTRVSTDEPFATADDNTSNSASLKKVDSLDTSTSSTDPPVRKHHRDSKSLPIRSDGSLDYDALYEDESDEDISMESHGSVVTHLLSQVKIGMDLTKVVLPTFILERRSLLEMYADYFAHPDLFLKIADLTDARDRMVQVVRWYLSVYHAGRKSSVAKKPYNPILGEIFRCHWDIPEMVDKEDETSKEVPEGPVPWCRTNQLSFVAEQVSHHPPISAFYAENYNKRISFSAHVWTKSKFLGLSIGVQNIGQGIVTLCDLNEDYILTFPNGYGRSILTVPWIELGGNVTITCPKTGYRAEIDFLTKPFYGGKKNKIAGEIYAPNDKKSFISITGEWSGLMEYKYNDGRQPSKPELFVDVNRIPIFKKLVRPVSEQDENESRRVWREVTAGLKMNDIDRATNAKFTVEHKQREEAKYRKETSGEWEHKYFKAAGENWSYINPLLSRLKPTRRDSKR